MLLFKFVVLLYSHEYALIAIILNQLKQLVQKSRQFVVYLQKLQGMLLKQFVKIVIITTFYLSIKEAQDDTLEVCEPERKRSKRPMTKKDYESY